jgi:hypothetical protein
MPFGFASRAEPVRLSKATFQQDVPPNRPKFFNKNTAPLATGFFLRTQRRNFPATLEIEKWKTKRLIVQTRSSLG